MSIGFRNIVLARQLAKKAGVSYSCVVGYVTSVVKSGESVILANMQTMQKQELHWHFYRVAKMTAFNPAERSAISEALKDLMEQVNVL